MDLKLLEDLEQGNVHFLYQLPLNEQLHLAKLVRNSPKKKTIIASILPVLKTSLPRFCFEIIYDMEEYKDETLNLIDDCFAVNLMPPKYLFNLLEETSFGFEYLSKNFDRIIYEYQRDLDFIFEYLFANFEKCETLLKKLAYHQDMHMRFLFMNYLIKHHFFKTSFFYDDIIKHLVKDENNGQKKLMSMEDISLLAITILDSNNYSLYQKFKTFILQNYKYNNLGANLVAPKPISEELFFRLIPNLEGIAEFETDADTYFSSLATNRLQIYENYSRKISLILLQTYKKQLEIFKRRHEIDENYEHIDMFGLTRLLEEYVSKYLDLSHDKTHEFISAGTTASCYRIGDFAFKLIRTKWSYENVICPNLYLILPNLEEVLLRDRAGIVKAGIEVQKFLRRSAKNIPSYIFEEFIKELKRLGYYSTDSLINGSFGDNTRLLDDYREAGSEVASWFREYPLVLVDRDRIYPLSDYSPKQQIMDEEFFLI